MKIWLDDRREAPKGYKRCYWPLEVIDLMQGWEGEIDVLSLDHDLGDDDKGTGYDVLIWLEAQVIEDPNYPLPKVIRVHSSNPPAKKRMDAAIKSIYRRANQEQERFG